MAETILLEKVDVQEKIIYLDIKRIGADGKAFPQKAKAFKSAEPYLKVGEKIEADVEHQPATDKFPESWLVKPVADKKPARGGSGVAKSDPVKNAMIDETSRRKNEGIQLASQRKQSTTCMELAVMTLGPDQDVNAYRNRALDFYQAINEVAHVGEGKA